jgi:hypothetical protein
MGTLFVGWRGRATLACCDFQLLLQLTNNLLQKSAESYGDDLKPFYE